MGERHAPLDLSLWPRADHEDNDFGDSGKDPRKEDRPPNPLRHGTRSRRILSPSFRSQILRPKHQPENVPNRSRNFDEVWSTQAGLDTVIAETVIAKECRKWGVFTCWSTMDQPSLAGIDTRHFGIAPSTCTPWTNKKTQSCQVGMLKNHGENKKEALEWGAHQGREKTYCFGMGSPSNVSTHDHPSYGTEGSIRKRTGMSIRDTPSIYK